MQKAKSKGERRGCTEIVMRPIKIIFYLSFALCQTLPMWSQNDKSALRDSLTAATEALAYHPDSVDLRLRKAGWNVRLEQWQYALDEYSYVLKQEPNNIAALFYRAYVNERLYRYRFARLDYEHLLRIVPGHFEGALGLALLNQKDKHYTEALDGINQLVNAYPKSAIAWAARAGMEEEQGMLELSEYDYTQAIELAPNNTDYLLSRADIRIRLGQLGKARQDLEALVKLGMTRAALGKWFDKCKRE